MLNSSSIFLQQHDCQLTGCLNAGSCTFTEESKVFSCICQEGWCGKYCGGKLLLNILVAWTELIWYTQALRQRRKRNTRVSRWSVNKCTMTSNWRQYDKPIMEGEKLGTRLEWNDGPAWKFVFIAAFEKSEILVVHARLRSFILEAKTKLIIK